MLVLGLERHKMVGQDSINTFLKNFAVYVKQRYGAVALQEYFIAFFEDWRDSGNFLAIW